MSNLKIEHHTCRTQEPYEQWLERKVQEYEHSHTTLVRQRDALKEALENLINICENSGGPEWAGWGWVSDGIDKGQAILDAVKEKT